MKRKAKKVVKAKAKVVAPRAASSVAPMDAEFESDWLAEQGMVRGDYWEAPGASRGACEVQLKDKTVVGPCVPDGDAYRRMDAEADIPKTLVVKVRRYGRSALPDECEDGDDGPKDLLSFLEMEEP